MLLRCCHLALAALLLGAACGADGDAKPTLESLFDELLAPTLAVTEPEELHRNVHAMGPTLVKCIRAEPGKPDEVLLEKAYGNFPSEGANAAVGLRSISKTLTSLAVLRLVEKGMISLDTRVKDALEYNCGPAGEATVHELLSMSSKAMDNRINALRIQQLFRRGEDVDFIGFPPICDNLRWDVERCARDFVCPLIRGDANVWVIAGFEVEEPPIDITCGETKEERILCLQAVRNNPDVCKSSKDFMAHRCSFACIGDIECDAETGKYRRVSNSSGEIAYHWDFNRALNRLTRRIRRGMVYDNNGYLLVDAMVHRRTGHALVHWVKELVLGPLDMQASLSCLGRSCPAGIACYGPVSSVEATHGDWPPWRGGLHSQSWVSNAFFGSANDLVSLVSMFLRNGTTASGTKLISPEQLHVMFEPHHKCNQTLHQCLGVHMFSCGLGACAGADEFNWHKSPTYKRFDPPANYFSKEPYSSSVSMCLAPNVWGWASSYGSRFLFLRDQGIGCAMMMNQYSGRTKLDEAFSSRAHYLAHNASAILRFLYPETS